MPIAGSFDKNVINEGWTSATNNHPTDSGEPVTQNGKKRKRNAPQGAPKVEWEPFIIQACERICDSFGGELT